MYEHCTRIQRIEVDQQLAKWFSVSPLCQLFHRSAERARKPSTLRRSSEMMGCADRRMNSTHVCAGAHLGLCRVCLCRVRSGPLVVVVVLRGRRGRRSRSRRRGGGSSSSSGVCRGGRGCSCSSGGVVARGGGSGARRGRRGRRLLHGDAVTEAAGGGEADEAEVALRAAGALGARGERDGELLRADVRGGLWERV